MELLSTKLARAIWVFPVRDMNPRGLDMWSIMPELASRYRFLKSPDIPALINSGLTSLEFQFGKFDSPDNGQIEVSLQIHEDGLVADSQLSTDASEELMRDLVSWLVSEYGLTPPAQVKKIYLSEVYFKSDRALSSLANRFADFLAALSNDLDDEFKRKLEPIGLHFGYEVTSALKTAPVFRLERAVDAPHLDNRFYSSANVSTNAHRNLLGLLEAALAPT